MILQMSIFPFIAILSVSHSTGSNGRSAKKGLFFALWKYDITDISLFASYCYFIQDACHRFRKKNQLFGTTDNLLSHFEWANADKKVFMCLLKGISVIVARRMLFKRNTFRCQFPQCKKKETNTEQCRQQSSKLIDRELSSISCTMMYMFTRGLSFVFFFRTLTTKEKTMEKLAINL